MELNPRTPISDHMYHAEVLGLANTWLKKCRCIGKQIFERKDYPTRLINLAELKKLGTIDTKEWKYYAAPGSTELHDAKVNLVRTDSLDWTKLKDKSYVTLSHKWGGTDKPPMLMRETMEKYQNGVQLGSLPKTFQDASKQFLVSLPIYLITSICPL